MFVDAGAANPILMLVSLFCLGFELTKEAYFENGCREHIDA